MEEEEESEKEVNTLRNALAPRTGKSEIIKSKGQYPVIITFSDLSLSLFSSGHRCYGA